MPEADNGESASILLGGIESLANAGSFSSQVHSIGPTLFYNPAAEEEGEGPNDDDNDQALENRTV